MAYNKNEIPLLADDTGNGTAETGVIQWAIDSASNMIYSIVQGRDGYGAADRADMVPSDYNTTTNPYPVLGYRTAPLVIAVLKTRQGRFLVPHDHPSLLWAREVRKGNADIVAS
jgi:hypothetical protein